MPDRMLSDLEKGRLASLQADGPVALLFPTENILRKSTFDAPPLLRHLLGAAGIHDFDAQEVGPEARALHAALLGTRGTPSRASMYRPRTKGGIFRRIWFRGLDQYATGGDALAVLVDEGEPGRPIRIYNLTTDDGLDAPTVDARIVQPPKKRSQTSQRRPRLAGRAPSNPDEELGRAGEEWVLAFERDRLELAGRHDLVERIEWVSETSGDTPGYDIASFETDGSPRCIEVKTTRGTKRAAFIITSNEVRASRELGEQFWLYRVFDFDGEPRVWMRSGAVDAYCDLGATEFRARPL